MKFRRRAIEVEAWQNDDAGPAMPDWLARISKRVRGGVLTFPISPSIGEADLGDWVVLKRDGTIAVLDPETFGREFEQYPAAAQKTRDDMPASYAISGVLPRDLANGISDAVHAALERGMTVDEACCVAVGAVADYWRYAFGNGSLNTLAKRLVARGNDPMPGVEAGTEIDHG